MTRPKKPYSYYAVCGWNPEAFECWYRWGTAWRPWPGELEFLQGM